VEQSKRINEIAREAQGKMLISVIVGGTMRPSPRWTALRSAASRTLLSIPR
jgi:hypothetical protein